MNNNQNLLIRAAVVSDLEAMLPLMAQLGYPQNLEDFKKKFKNFLEQKDANIIVAELENKIVGWVAWANTFLIVSPMRRLHIEGLVVDENCRGQKIGKALMQHVEEIAKQYSPCIVDLTSGLRRAKMGTHQFYHALGYRNKGDMEKVYLRKIL